MDSRRLDILTQTLKNGVVDKHFFEIVSSMTAEEWVEVIEDHEAHIGLLPFLIYTYDSGKMDDVEAVVGSKLGKVLSLAWFEIYHAGSRNEEDQPDIQDLGSTPCLVPLLNGHLLKMLEGAGYNDEFGDFIRNKHSQIITQLVPFVTNATEKQVLRLIFGASETAGIFPPVSDYDVSEVDTLLSYAYLLNSIQYAAKLIGLNDVSDLNEGSVTEALISRDFESIMTLASYSETKKRRNIRELVNVEDFIIQTMPDHISTFSSYSLMEGERLYLSSLFESGKLNANQEIAQLDELQAVTEDLVQDPVMPTVDLGDLVDPDSFGKPLVPEDEEPNKSSKPYLSNVIESLKAKFVRYKPDGEQVESEDSIEDMLVKNGSKKKGSILNPIILGICLLGFLTWFIALQGGNSETNSIIEQKAPEEQEKAFLPAVKVHTK